MQSPTPATSAPFPAPPFPELPADQSHTAETLPRYEDIAQDGRVTPLGVLPSMSGLWHYVLRAHPGQRAAIAQRIIPIMTRLKVTALEAPIRVDRPVESRAGFLLARDGDGDDARLYLNVWAELRGAAGRVGARPPGPPVLAGHLFAEHTFTRPFAPPDQRRVSRLPGEGFPELPQTRYAAPAAATAAEAPPGARWLDELAPDPAGVAFTLDQTDSNQHVNSLVYLRVFLDAVQRRLAAAGRPLAVLSRAVDIAYRKPCFAGDRVRAHLRLFEIGEGPDAAVGAGGGPASSPAPARRPGRAATSASCCAPESVQGHGARARCSREDARRGLGPPDPFTSGNTHGLDRAVGRVQLSA